MKKQYKASIISAFYLLSLCNLSHAVDLINDSDGDGWSNTNEIVAATDPNNGTDFPVPKINVSSTYSGTNLDYNSYPLFVYVYNDASSTNMGGRYDAILKPASSKVIESVTFDSDGNASLSSTKIAPRTMKILGHRHDSCDIPKDESSGSLWCYYSGSPSINYNTGAISGGPPGVSIKVSYDKTDAIESHIRSGWNRFFGFLDLNGNETYDVEEPAGMSVANKHNIDSSGANVEIALSDYLIGYPRLSWPASTNTNYIVNDSYVVTISSSSTTATIPVRSPRTFLHEMDFVNAGANQGGLDFGAGTSASFDYSVSLGTYVIDTGTFYYGLGTSADRKTMALIYPTTNDVVDASAVEFKWKMDYRGEGARISIVNTGTSVTYYDKLINFPIRHGRVTDSSYYYSATPQTLYTGVSEFTLPSGNYSYTIKEYIRTTSGDLTKQSITDTFTVVAD